MRVHINQTDSESVKSVVNKCQEDIFRCFNAFLCGNDWIDSYNNFALWEAATTSVVIASNSSYGAGTNGSKTE